MTERGVLSEALAQAAGVSRQAVRGWLRAEWIPTSPVAYKVAEALDYLPLYGMVLRERRGICGQCGRQFINNGTSNTRRWCNATCRDRFRRGGAARQSAEQIAIARRCRQCEPKGTCYDGGCALRRYSPFPVAPDLLTPLAVPSDDARRRSWTPERRAAQSLRMRAIVTRNRAA